MAGGVPAGRLSIEIVAEIARLQQDLDKAKRAVNAASKDISKSVGAANDNLGKMTKVSGNAAFAMRNLGFQVQDVITQLSLGQSPMKVFAAQGFQITDALGQMRREAEKTGQSMSSMLVGSLGKFGPLLVAAAVAAAALSVALKILQDDLNETGKVQLSFGDIALGTMDAIAAYARDKLGPAYEWLADTIGTVWEYIATASKTSANIMVGIMIAVPKTIYAAFTTLPAAIAELFVNMANGAIKAIEDLVNKAIGGLNSFAGMVNGLLGTSIGGVGNVTFGRIENNFKGAGNRAGAALADGIASGFGDHWGKIGESIRPFAEARRLKRLTADAEDGGKKAGKAGGKAGGKAMADEWAEAFAEEWATAAKNIVAILDEGMKQFEDAAKADSDYLNDVLAASDAAWQDWYAGQEDGIRRLQEQVDALVSSLSRLPGIGGLLGQIGTVLTSGNPIAAMLGMGGLGTIAGSILGGGDLTAKMGVEFQQAILTTLPKVSAQQAADIGNTLAGLFQGAAIGGAVGGVLGGGSSGMLGATAGGALGNALGSGLSALGKFGGPIGSMVGSVLGNVIGGLFNSTKRGGQTISNGALAGTWGNSSSRTQAATGIAGNAIDALGQLADALGVSLGSFSSSVSVRKNDLRFDPTGSGISKTSKGAISFGQDEEALLKAVIKDAISDGAFEGLSEGFKKYLTSGDVESRLQDVLNLKAIQNEAASLRDPQGFALGELDKQFDKLREIAKATGEGLADIEYVYGKRREEILQAANDNSLEIERDRKALLIQIAELEGKSTEALAMARDLEKASADESLHPLYDRIYALQDEQAAAAQAAAEAAELARVQAEAAAEAQRLADELERVQQAIAQERYGLETRLLQLQGDTVALRERELAALDPSNRDLLQLIFNLEDMQAAAAEAALAAEALAREQAAAAAEAQRIADELAAKQKAIADERYGLETQLLQLLGKTEELRARELELLDPSNRDLQLRIWAIQDEQAAAQAAAEAAQAHADALNSARDALSQAYGRERSELEQTRDKFRDFASTIRDFRLDLLAANDNSVVNARDRFLKAAGGKDPAEFVSSAQGFLDSSLATAGSRLDYQRAVSLVAGQATDMGRRFGNQAASAERQIQLLEDQVSQWIDLNENVLTVEQAIADLEALGAEKLPEIADRFDAGMSNVASRVDALGDRLEASEAMTRAALESVAQWTAQTANIFKRIENNGSLAVSTRDGDTVTQVAA